MESISDIDIKNILINNNTNIDYYSKVYDSLIILKESF